MPNAICIAASSQPSRDFTGSASIASPLAVCLTSIVSPASCGLSQALCRILCRCIVGLSLFYVRVGQSVVRVLVADTRRLRYRSVVASALPFPCLVGQDIKWARLSVTGFVGCGSSFIFICPWAVSTDFSSSFYSVSPLVSSSAFQGSLFLICLSSL